MESVGGKLRKSKKSSPPERRGRANRGKTWDQRGLEEAKTKGGQKDQQLPY